MDRICFSKDYIKLHGQSEAVLLYVRRMRIDENTPVELINYDTSAKDGSKYLLIEGNYIQLVFLGNLGIPFCTLRLEETNSNMLKTKYEYYSERIGHNFKLIKE